MAHNGGSKTRNSATTFRSSRVRPASRYGDLDDPVDLREIDSWMRRAYEQIKVELEEVEAELRAVEARRDALMQRAVQLELGLGLQEPPSRSPNRTPPERPVTRQVRTPAPSPGPSPSPTPPPAPGQPGRRRGELWHDVQTLLESAGPLQAVDIVKHLLTAGYPDSEHEKTRIYNSLGRWAREGKLHKRERGRYQLP